MDDQLKKLLDKQKMKDMKQLNLMEPMGGDLGADISEQDMEALDINKRLAKGVELERQKEIADRAAAKKQEEQAIAEREAQGEEEYKDKLKKIRMEEYNKEIAEKGYADKADYPDLFPPTEISPMQKEEEERKRLGYK